VGYTPQRLNRSNTSAQTANAVEGRLLAAVCRPIGVRRSRCICDNLLGRAKPGGIPEAPAAPSLIRTLLRMNGAARIDSIRCSGGGLIGSVTAKLKRRDTAAVSKLACEQRSRSGKVDR
jgi:hypothetical protein